MQTKQQLRDKTRYQIQCGYVTARDECCFCGSAGCDANHHPDYNDSKIFFRCHTTCHTQYHNKKRAKKKASD